MLWLWTCPPHPSQPPLPHSPSPYPTPYQHPSLPTCPHYTPALKATHGSITASPHHNPPPTHPGALPCHTVPPSHPTPYPSSTSSATLSFLTWPQPCGHATSSHSATPTLPTLTQPCSTGACPMPSHCTSELKHLISQAIRDQGIWGHHHASLRKS